MGSSNMIDSLCCTTSRDASDISTPALNAVSTVFEETEEKQRHADAKNRQQRAKRLAEQIVQ